LIAALFVAVVGVAMLVAHGLHKSSDPWKSPGLLQLKEQLRAEPQNQALKQQIRELDLRLRQRYFHLLAFKAVGIWLLFGGVGVLLLAGARVRQLTRRPPLPQPNPDAATRRAAQTCQSRRVVAIVGVVAAATLAALGLISSPSLTHDPAALEKVLAGGQAGPAAAPDCASPEELRANWPAFRGFDGSGMAALGMVLAGAQNGKSPEGATTPRPIQFAPGGALWKTPAPALGFSSPLLWGERVFFTGGDAVKREVFCLDAGTGAPLWRQAVGPIPGAPPSPPDISDMTSYAPNTAATDGRRLYAMFATGELAAFTLDGRRLWARHLGTPRNPYGHATSLATWRDRVVVLLDQGEPENRLSRLLLLDGRTGAAVWEKPRPVGASWASPIVIQAAGRTQIITLAVPWILAYDADNGAELWRVEALDGEVTPSPVFAGGLLFVVSPSTKLLAIRPDGAGDVTRSHVAWSVEEPLPDIASPVSNGELVFTVTSSGLLACFDAQQGRKLWEHDFGTECHASPSLVGDSVLLVGNKGDVIAAAAAREFKELFRVKLDDAFQASPALAAGKVILRGSTNLWCFGSKP
jgi:outer membrane protein assembly factor BamB